jgi:hypothetical protein
MENIVEFLHGYKYNWDGGKEVRGKGLSHFGII